MTMAYNTQKWAMPFKLTPKKPTCCIRTHTQIIHPYTNKFCNTGQSSAPLCYTDWTLNLKCAWSVSQNNSAFHVFQYWFTHKHTNMSKFIYPVACLSAPLYTEKNVYHDLAKSRTMFHTFVTQARNVMQHDMVLQNHSSSFIQPCS